MHYSFPEFRPIQGRGICVSECICVCVCVKLTPPVANSPPRLNFKAVVQTGETHIRNTRESRPPLLVQNAGATLLLKTGLNL